MEQIPLITSFSHFTLTLVLCSSHLKSHVSGSPQETATTYDWQLMGHKRASSWKQISKVYGNVNDLGDHRMRLTSFKACSLMVNKNHIAVHRITPSGLMVLFKALSQDKKNTLKILKSWILCNGWNSEHPTQSSLMILSSMIMSVHKESR